MILRTSLHLLRPPRVATHPLFPEQPSNKTKTTLDPLRTKQVKTLTSVHRHHRTNTNISGWSSGLPGKKEHRAGRGPCPGDLYEIGPMTSEAGKPTRTLNAGNFILFLDRKRLVGEKLRGTAQKYFLLTYYLFSRSLKYKQVLL